MSTISHCLVTDTGTGTSAYTALCDLAETIAPWFPDAPEDVTDAIAQLQVQADRGDTAAADATAEFLGLAVDWAPGPADDPAARWGVHVEVAPDSLHTPGAPGWTLALRVEREDEDTLEPEWAVGSAVLPDGWAPDDWDAVYDATAAAAADALAPHGLVARVVGLDQPDTDGDLQFGAADLEVQTR